MDNDTNYDAEDSSSSSWYFGEDDSNSELHIRIPIFTVYAIGFLVGMTGNLLVIFAVVKSRRLHNVTCLFLANLAVADLMTVVFLIPLQITVYYIGSWSLGDALCRLAAYLHIVSPVCSIFTMMIISLERYYVVLYPLQAKSVVTMGRAKRVVACLWLASIIFSIPALFSKREITHYIDGHGTMKSCESGWRTETLAEIYTVYLFLLLFLVPLIVVSYAYMKLACNLCSTRGRNIGTTNGSPFSKPAEPKYKVWYRNRCGWSSGSSFARRAEVSRTNGVTIDDEATEADALRSEPGRTEDINDSPAPRRHRNTGESDKIQRVVTMLVIVVALFILSWGPLLIFSMVMRFSAVPSATPAVIITGLILHLVAACNSCINPIIYAFLSKNFRQSFKQVIWDCCCCCLESRRQKRLGYQPSFRWTRASRTSYSYAPPGSVLRSSTQMSSSLKADV